MFFIYVLPRNEFYPPKNARVEALAPHMMVIDMGPG